MDLGQKKSGCLLISASNLPKGKLTFFSAFTLKLASTSEVSWRIETFAKLGLVVQGFMNSNANSETE